MNLIMNKLIRKELKNKKFLKRIKLLANCEKGDPSRAHITTCNDYVNKLFCIVKCYKTTGSPVKNRHKEIDKKQHNKKIRQEKINF